MQFKKLTPEGSLHYGFLGTTMTSDELITALETIVLTSHDCASNKGAGHTGQLAYG